MSVSRDRDEPKTPGAFRLGFASGAVAFVSLIGFLAYAISLWVAFNTAELQPPRTLGPPLRVASAGIDSVFLMTAQQETRVVGGGSRFRTYAGFETVTHVDLWRFDASSAQPVWRKRLLTERGGSIFDLGVLGAEGDRLWIFMREPLVMSLASGDVLANASVVEARNTPLQGVLPRRMSHYKFFDGHGLVFTAADARAWRLDAQTLEAVPWQPKSSVPRTTAIGPAYYAASSSTSFQKRGLLLPTRWLGVLTDAEAEAVKPPKPLAPGERRGAMAAHNEYMRAPPDLSHAGPKRYRLWHAKVEQVSAAPEGWSKQLPDNWGKRPYYSNFVVFEKSLEYLQAGLLSDGRSNIPLLLKEPDSVLVLHRDRIDEEGRLHVMRFAGPDGRVLWDTGLPLTIMQSVMPSTGPLLLFGRGYVQPRPAVGDPYHSAHEWLISLDTASGAVKTFNISAADEEKKNSQGFFGFLL